MFYRVYECTSLWSKEKCCVLVSVTMFWRLLIVVAVCHSAGAVRINFTSCQQPEWSCVNNVPSDIVYSCSVVSSNDFIIHLKDYYTEHIKSVTVENCRDLRVVLDCPILQKSSQLQKFKVKDCDRLEFITLSSTSLIQTPPEVVLHNIREIVAFPRKLFKSPSTTNELKCAGAPILNKILVTNSKINTINTNSIYNVTGIKNIEFDNVTIVDIKDQGINAIMGNGVFTLRNSKIENLEINAVTVQGTTVTVSQNSFSDVVGNAINITADYLYITDNSFKDIYANGWLLKSVYTDITNNDIALLKRGAFTNVKCSYKRTVNKRFSFTHNRIASLEPFSLAIDYPSCKIAATVVSFKSNKIDCKCRNIAFLRSATINTEFNNMFLDVNNNNTCISAPCLLPVEIVKLLLENNMCQIKLDSEVMCLLYNDRRGNNEVTTDDDNNITEPSSTFYVVGHANSASGEASAAMTAIDTDILKANHFNMTNRTTVKIVFDSSKDFVETLRSASTTHRRPAGDKTPNAEYVNNCVGSNCKNNAYNKQKALDFYKYIYAQLRQPVVPKKT